LNSFILKRSVRHVWVFLPKLTHVRVFSKIGCRYLNLRGRSRPSSWSESTPCVGTPDNPLHRFRIPPPIVRAVDGTLHVLCWTRIQSTAGVAGPRFSGTLRRCEQKKRRQKKKMRCPSLDSPSTCRHCAWAG
jgi:hypothetical protein